VKILTGRPSHIEELVISKKINLNTPSPAPWCCTSSMAFMPVLGCTNPLAEGPCQLGYCNRGAYRLLPLGTSNCNALPLSKSAARSSYMSILSVWH